MEWSKRQAHKFTKKKKKQRMASPTDYRGSKPTDSKTKKKLKKKQKKKNKQTNPIQSKSLNQKSLKAKENPKLPKSPSQSH